MATPVTNVLYNFGWEYVWHCHILAHEENDMMRAIQFNVARALPVAPVLTATGTGTVTLNWTDGTPFDYSTWTPASTLGHAQNEVGFRIERATNQNFTQGYTSITVFPNKTTYTDNTVTGGTRYYYKVTAFNAAGSVVSNVVNITP